MTLVRSTSDDPLFRVADQVPLGQHLGLVTATDEVPSEPDVRPFGLRFATSTGAPIQVELSELRYDRRGQTTVDDIGAPVFGKHSTGQTSDRDQPVGVSVLASVKTRLPRKSSGVSVVSSSLPTS
ncbi:MAG: putative ATP-grasp-modified RiPP [Pseudonocardiaceae bacterium]